VSDKPVTLVVDSTGLKVHSEVGWNFHKHGAQGTRKTWRRLHLAFDPDLGDIRTDDRTLRLCHAVKGRVSGAGSANAISLAIDC
jgi:hypothetical protein